MLWDIFKEKTARTSEDVRAKLRDETKNRVAIVVTLWLKWRKDWDSLCNRCGKCCYSRSAWAKGKVAIHYDSPCEYLDVETHLCKVYKDRFRKCNHCGKVNLFVALFHPTLHLEVAPCKNALRALARPTFSIS